MKPKVKFISADWKDIDNKGGLIEQFVKAFRSYGLHIYQDSELEGTDMYGFIVSDQKLTKKQIKELLK
ncbi:MAG: hypothetical protein WCX48_09780 [Bacteroidales bacterium]